jgi:hypothetical protein
LDFYFSISERPLKALKIWLLEDLPWVGEGERQEESELNAQRRAEVIQELTRGWKCFEDGSIFMLTQAIDKAFASLSSALDAA